MSHAVMALISSWSWNRTLLKAKGWNASLPLLADSGEKIDSPLVLARKEYKWGSWLLKKSYLLREVMCSSDRPPSSSLMMKSLSFSSAGCTAKLLRKMSARTRESTAWARLSFFFFVLPCNGMTGKKKTKRLQPNYASLLPNTSGETHICNIRSICFVFTHSKAAACENRLLQEIFFFFMQM